MKDIHSQIVGQFDAAANRARLQGLADQQLLDARERANDERAAGLPAGALSPEALEGFDDGPSDSEIISMVVEVYGITPAKAVERLERIDFAKARELARA